LVAVDDSLLRQLSKQFRLVEPMTLVVVVFWFLTDEISQNVTPELTKDCRPSESNRTMLHPIQQINTTTESHSVDM